MSTTLFTPPHFFKPLLPGFEDDFLIPLAFSKHLKGQACEKAILGSRKGEKLWPVKVNGRQFQDGWKQFAKDHELQIGDFVVFRYDGDLVFYVMVFDRTTCEKEYGPPTAIGEKQIHIQEQNLSRGKKEKTILQHAGCEKETPMQEHNLPEDSASGKKVKARLAAKAKARVAAKGSSSIVQHPLNDSTRGTRRKYKKPKTASEAKATSYVVQQNFFLAKVTSYRLEIPEWFARLQFQNIKRCQVILIDREGNSWPANFQQKDSDDEAYIGDGWNEFRMANNLEQGDSFVFEFMEKSKPPRLIMHEFKTNNKIGNSPASSMDKPYFFVMVVASAVRNRRTRIPRDFAWDNGLATSKCPDITIKNEIGNSWTVKTKMDKNGEVFISYGWTEFVEANGIIEGDVLLLQLVKEEGQTPLLNYYATKQEIGSNQEGIGEDFEHVNPTEASTEIVPYCTRIV